MRSGYDHFFEDQVALEELRDLERRKSFKKYMKNLLIQKNARMLSVKAVNSKLNQIEELMDLLTRLNGYIGEETDFYKVGRVLEIMWKITIDWEE